MSGSSCLLLMVSSKTNREGWGLPRPSLAHTQPALPIDPLPANAPRPSMHAAGTLYSLISLLPSSGAGVSMCCASCLGPAWEPFPYAPLCIQPLFVALLFWEQTHPLASALLCTLFPLVSCDCLTFPSIAQNPQLATFTVAQDIRQSLNESLPCNNVAANRCRALLCYAMCPLLVQVLHARAPPQEGLLLLHAAVGRLPHRKTHHSHVSRHGGSTLLPLLAGQGWHSLLLDGLLEDSKAGSLSLAECRRRLKMGRFAAARQEGLPLADAEAAEDGVERLKMGRLPLLAGQGSHWLLLLLEEAVTCRCRSG